MEGRLKELALLFLKLRHGCIWRPRGACRNDGRRSRAAEAVAFSRRLPGLVCRHESDSRTKLDGDGDSHRPQAGRWPGLLVAGICFILPAACIVLALAWVYVRFGKLPEAEGILYGVKPVVIAVVQALWGLGRTAVKTKFLAVTGILNQ
jgi:hypothetical protein